MLELAVIELVFLVVANTGFGHVLKTVLTIQECFTIAEQCSYSVKVFSAPHTTSPGRRQEEGKELGGTQQISVWQCLTSLLHGKKHMPLLSCFFFNADLFNFLNSDVPASALWVLTGPQMKGTGHRRNCACCKDFLGPLGHSLAL